MQAADRSNKAAISHAIFRLPRYVQYSNFSCLMSKIPAILMPPTEGSHYNFKGEIAAYASPLAQPAACPFHVDRRRGKNALLKIEVKPVFGHARPGYTAKWTLFLSLESRSHSLWSVSLSKVVRRFGEKRGMEGGWIEGLQRVSPATQLADGREMLSAAAKVTLRARCNNDGIF